MFLCVNILYLCELYLLPLSHLHDLYSLYIRAWKSLKKTMVCKWLLSPLVWLRHGMCREIHTFAYSLSPWSVNFKRMNTTIKWASKNPCFLWRSKSIPANLSIMYKKIIFYKRYDLTNRPQFIQGCTITRDNTWWETILDWKVNSNWDMNCRSGMKLPWGLSFARKS